jgi:hypothetical protein
MANVENPSFVCYDQENLYKVSSTIMRKYAFEKISFKDMYRGRFPLLTWIDEMIILVTEENVYLRIGKTQRSFSLISFGPNPLSTSVVSVNQGTNEFLLFIRGIQYKISNLEKMEKVKENSGLLCIALSGETEICVVQNKSKELELLIKHRILEYSTNLNHDMNGFWVYLHFQIRISFLFSSHSRIALRRSPFSLTVRFLLI